MIEIDTRRTLRRQRVWFGLLAFLSVTAASWNLLLWPDAPLVSVIVHLVCALMWLMACLDAHQELDRITLHDKDVS